MKDDIKTEVPTSQPKAVDGIVPRPQQPAKEEAQSQVASADQLPAEATDIPPTPQAPEKPKSKSGKKLPIVLALIVLITFAGLAIYIGLNKDKSDKQANSNSKGTSQTAAGTTIEQDKQQTAEIVNDINDLQDDTDNSGDGLTDKNLGL